MGASYSTPKAAWWVALVSRCRRYVLLLKKWWWLALLAASAGAFSGAVWCWRQPVSFVSQGRMMVGGRVSMAENVSYSEELANFAGTNVELMQSADVQRRAAQRVAANQPGLSPCPVGISASLLARTSIFVLVANGAEPEYTQKFLNAVMEEYIAMKREMRSEKSENTAGAISDAMKNMD
jgi:polysaccharide biosynthesis transport protein